VTDSANWDDLTPGPLSAPERGPGGEVIPRTLAQALAGGSGFEPTSVAPPSGLMQSPVT
jgi:hypothetical protein